MSLTHEAIHAFQFEDVFDSELAHPAVPRRLNKPTRVTIGACRDRRILTLHIHPKDVESLGVKSNTMWALGIYNHVDDQGGLINTVVFFENKRSISPRLVITKSGWGKWDRTFDKEVIEKTILRGPIQKTIIPRVEVVRSTANTPIMTIAFPGWEQKTPEDERLCEMSSAVSSPVQ
jgi:hypothetical protein